MKSKLEKMFGSYLFTDDIMKKYLPKKVFNNYIKTKNLGESLTGDNAKIIAQAIKKWALKMGATHYSHWFLPLTGKTAEKQVSFLDRDSNGKGIETFNEKALIKGETDASSFPNGGDRVTFEARGYTVWDYTSPVFIKEDIYNNKVLYIPTAFCSYNGLALDEKTPLLRAVEQLNTSSLKVLKLLGYNDVNRVICEVGAEQEYFLIKKQDYEKRFDLKMTGRTLLGGKPTKSQEVHSHYFGAIDDEISLFMNEVDKELWKMGISAKLQHNEVAPSQYELVPIYNNVNIANDQNQIIMEVLSRIAKKYNFVALFHEKPFKYINGSGKHINWSLSTDTGLSLLNSSQKDKTLFLTFFVAVISALDEYYSLIRCSTAFRGNDLRLGEKEAPPTLISVFIGNQLEELLNSLENLETNKKGESKKLLDTRVKALPKMVKDYCDRNRTSPFAFGGNKFEFRMTGSSQTVAWPSVCVCTVVAKILNDIAEKLTVTKIEPRKEVYNILKEMINSHKKIIFNGNGFDKSWAEEAKNRGLKEFKNSLEAFKVLDDEKIINLFETTNVLNREELNLRKNTLYNSYFDAVLVEGKTLKEMIYKKIYPSLLKYLSNLTSFKGKNCSQNEMYKKMQLSLDKFFKQGEDLTNIITSFENAKSTSEKEKINKKLLNIIDEIRDNYDEIEPFLPNDIKPYPFYNDILF